jgi:hypothetical protein
MSVVKRYAMNISHDPHLDFCLSRLTFAQLLSRMYVLIGKKITVHVSISDQPLPRA